MIVRFGSLLSGGAALAMVLGCYTVSLKVSGERKAVDDLRGKIAGDLRGIRTLQAELRTRSRLPELQRWNDEVLAMGAPGAAQFVRDPVQLASFVSPVAPAAPITPAAVPAVDYAIAPQPAPALSPLHTVSYSPSVAYSRPVATPQVAPARAAVQRTAVTPALHRSAPRLPTVSASLGLDDAVTGAITAAADSERAGLKRVSLR